MEFQPGRLSAVMRTLGRRVRSGWAATLCWCLPPAPHYSPRLSAVEKVSRNALAEMVGRARSQPQRGERDSASPAYVALAELTEEIGRPGLALGLRCETGEITFLDFDLAADKLDDSGAAFVSRRENLALWRRLEALIRNKVNRTMVGPRKPIRPPEEVDYEDR